MSSVLRQASDELSLGINQLPPQCLILLFSHLSARDCAQASCVQRSWRELLTDDLLWRQYLQADFGGELAHGPNDTAHPNYRSAYYAWVREFGAEYRPYIKRAHIAWNGIKGWLRVHCPAILASLAPAATKAELEAAGEKLGHPLPTPLKAIYRFHNGQTLRFDTLLDEDDSKAELDESIFHGLFGGYAVYDHLVSMRFLSLERMVKWTAVLQEQGGWPKDQPIAVFAASFNFRKILVINLATGTVVTRRQTAHDVFLHAAPPDTEPEAKDGALRWLCEYSRRLSDGYYAVGLLDEDIPISTSICIFPLKPPQASVAVTRGVQVRASPLYISENSSNTRYQFAYSVRFSLLPEEQQLQHWPATAGPFRPITTCQLLSRHWRILSEHGSLLDEVEGAGVIGKYPILQAGGLEFVYQSCTQQRVPRGAMEGSFRFVEGTIAHPTGGEWDVECARFELKPPEYVM